MFASLLLTSALLCQEPVKQDPPKPGDREPAAEQPEAAAPPQEARVVEDWDDKRVKAALTAFNTKMKSRVLKDRLAALDDIRGGRNAKLVAPLVAVVLRDRGLTVRKGAADLLGDQPPRQAKPAIVKLLGDSGVRDAPDVTATLVGALGRVGYERGRDWAAIDRLFEADYGPDRLALQRAVLALVREQRELGALEMLSRNLDEPAPENVDDASNPPAEYWERRWKAWQAWRPEVKETLFTLTGQQFSTGKEAREWVRANRAKLEKR
jgi:HEAT repeat protein